MYRISYRLLCLNFYYGKHYKQYCKQCNQSNTVRTNKGKINIKIQFQYEINNPQNNNG